MDIAIYFEKIDLGNDMVLFKPINIIRGCYDEKTEIFLTEYGVACSSIDGTDMIDEYYFGYLTNMEELKEKFGSSCDDECLLDEYLNVCCSNYHTGYFDYSMNKINVLQIPFDSVENLFYQSQEETELKEYNNDDQYIDKIAFSLEVLEELRDSKTMKEVRDKLNNLINLAHKLSNKDDVNSNQLIKQVGSFTSKTKSPIISLKELREEVSKKIIGQEHAINDLTREIIINQTSEDPRNKSHIMITGPTGTGKTEMVNIISKLLDLPCFEADATAYTKEGYVGKSVYSMINSLIDAAEGNVERAQKGILIIDEIDKKIEDSRLDSVSGIDVLYSLLKIMDRGVIEIEMGTPGYRKAIPFDTSDLTIILMGAFENLYNKKINENKSFIGFSDKKDILIPKTDVVVSKSDLLKGGMPAQVLGRIGDVTSTTALTIEELKKILTKSEISALLIMKKYFKDQLNIDLKYTDGYVTGIAKQAFDLGTNARELKPLVRDSIKSAFDYVYSNNNVKTLKLVKETVNDPRKFYVK